MTLTFNTRSPRSACAARHARLSIAGVNSEPLIELHGVSCARTEAGVCARIAGVSLVIEPGTVTLLVGEVGCGKNLLLRLLGLLEVPDSGEVLFAGQPTAQLTDDARVELRTHSCGYLFAAPFLLAQFSALENIAMPIFKISQLNPEQTRVRTEEVLAFTGLTKFAASKELSPVLQKRVALARGLANEPEVLFVENLDEMIAGDPDFRDLLHAATERFGVAVVAAALPTCAVRAGERRIEVAGGRVTCDVTP